MAHAICGNYELAEYAVQSAILDIFRRGTPRSRAGLRENLRARVRAMAVEQARLIDDAELTWDGFREDAIEGAEGDAVLQAASQESLEDRRALMLRYGCGLRPRDIARLLNVPAAQVATALTRFARRLKRRLPPREQPRTERAIARSARAWLEKQNAGVPDAGAVYRSMEAELMESGAPTHRVSRIVGTRYLRVGHRRRPLPRRAVLAFDGAHAAPAPGRPRPHPHRSGHRAGGNRPGRRFQRRRSGGGV